MKQTTILVAAGLLILVSLAGCRSGGSATSRWTHQTTAPAAYYLSGPQQMSPPDGTLPPGTKVRIISEQGRQAIGLRDIGLRDIGLRAVDPNRRSKPRR